MLLCSGKEKEAKQESEEIKIDTTVNEKEKLPNMVIMALRNLKILIKRIHIRFEDDYYAGEKPFSFGLMIDVSISDCFLIPSAREGRDRGEGVGLRAPPFNALLVD